MSKVKAKKAKPPKAGKKTKCPAVVLTDGMKPNPEEMHVSRGAAGSMCFQNDTSRGRTVHFDLWPFVEPPQDIQIKKHKTSPCFHIDPNQPLGGYQYSVTPALNPGGPPGEPQVVVDT